MCVRNKKAFSLVELLVVISTIMLLMAILMPVLAAARSQGRRVVCRSNLRQLFLANGGYAVENDDYYVPAAADIILYKGGKHRWHGVRDSADEPFDPAKGPLVGYLANGKVKQCPEKVDFTTGEQWDESFEKGCGGYGYNQMYIGSRNWQIRTFNSIAEARNAGWETTRITEVGRPAKTLMFTDTAFSKDGSSLIEYSFAEPVFWVLNGKLTASHPDPTIHFRHRELTNVVWADGHTDSREMADSDFGVDSAKMKLGWFEPLDNTLFDLK